MDSFLRVIGFSKIRTGNRYSDIQNDVIHNPDKRIIFSGDDGTVVVEYHKMYGDNLGIVLRGLIDERENIIVQSCEAFAGSDTDAYVNKYIVEYSNDEPVIVFEDIDTGNELVFELLNRVDLLKGEKHFIDYGRSVHFSKALGIIRRKVNYSGLSLHGKVILPVCKEAESYDEKLEEESFFNNLVLRFNEGDDDAGEMLKLYAEETTNVLRERLMEEDFLSIVEGYFLPMDYNESEYSILGDITHVGYSVNSVTKERVVKLTVNTTGTDIQIFINRKDLLGIPIKGMRFMGTCRLRGHVII
ncbi:MAG: DUF3881 family protein [Clostridiales bacterium]|jgi:hypothetical protein|nr:DUF3881 family protein [Clostridiales bacterium]